VVVGLIVTYLLNKFEIISVYIPHEYRKYCLKGYLTKEEKEAIKNDATYLERMTWNKTLVKCLSKTPGKDGFKIEDDYFEDHNSEHHDKPVNPNTGFKLDTDIKTFIYRD
jgi:hypothetical protein